MKNWRPKLIHIIGMGIGWELAPTMGETWGATNLILRRNVKRVINMNDYSNNRWSKEDTENEGKSRERAKELGIPYIDLENYPLKEIIHYFNTDYFGNTVDYMIALALDEHCHEINFYGVNMSTRSEYAFEQPSVNFWCGMAMGMGVKVRVFGKHSMIMKTNDGLLYGYYTPQESLEGR